MSLSFKIGKLTYFNLIPYVILTIELVLRSHTVFFGFLFFFFLKLNEKLEIAEKLNGSQIQRIC